MIFAIIIIIIFFWLNSPFKIAKGEVNCVRTFDENVTINICCNRMTKMNTFSEEVVFASH